MSRGFECAWVGAWEVLVRGAQVLELRTRTAFAAAAPLRPTPCSPMFLSPWIAKVSIHSSLQSPGGSLETAVPSLTAAPHGPSRRSPEAAQHHGHRLGSLSPITNLCTAFLPPLWLLTSGSLLCSHADFVKIQICSCYSSAEQAWVAPHSSEGKSTLLPVASESQGLLFPSSLASCDTANTQTYLSETLGHLTW